MEGRVQAHALGAADHLGNLALVDGAELREAAGLDLAGAVGEVLDHGEVLFGSSSAKGRHFFSSLKKYSGPVKKANPNPTPKPEGGEEASRDNSHVFDTGEGRARHSIA
jgi:hypothetical protein